MVPKKSAIIALDVRKEVLFVMISLAPAIFVVR